MNHARTSYRTMALRIESLENRELLTSTVFADSLGSDWQNWSWDTSVDLNHRSIVASGQESIQVGYEAGWAGLYLRVPNGTVDAEDRLTFSVHGGTTGGQTVKAFVLDQDDEWLEVATVRPVANQWTEVSVSMSSIGSPQKLTGIVLQEFTGDSQPAFYVDDIILHDDESEPPTGTATGPTITIDPGLVIREISDEVYGLNFADLDLAPDIDLPVNRWGGNSTTRYNYQVDASNKGFDWFFENHPDDNSNLGALPVGSSADRFVQEGAGVGANSIMTVGTIGWTAKDRDIVGAFSVEKYGPQQNVDPWRAYGDGVQPNGEFITGNDPLDTSIPIDEEFTRDWVEHLVSQHGTAEQGGVQYYALDNEPMLWNSTHRDVHPEPASYDEVLARGIVNAQAIKDSDPSAQVLGPTAWGWTAYHYSALDAAAGGAWWNNPLDRNSHGGQAFIPWYLESMAAAEAETGERLLDYLDIHYYPQNEGVTLTSTGGTRATQQTRLESTRSLWDPTYTDKTWINDEVQLVPKMRAWIDEFYPETKLAITEYNFGATGHINGAVTQADVLGIFGREGVDLATMWDPPSSNDPAAYAFRMYRNYDGQGEAGSRFGESAVSAVTSDVGEVSVFAATRDSDDALTIMLVNKSFDAVTSPIELPEDYDGLEAEIYTYDATDLNSIARGDDFSVDATNFEVTLPASSITLIELPSPGFVATEVAVNVVDFNRVGSPGSLSSITATLDGDGSDSELTLSTGSTEIDLSGLAPAWNINTQQATWDLSSLGLAPGRYQVSIQPSATSIAFATELLVAQRGDANLDGQVAFRDFLQVSQHFGQTNADWSQGDFDGDGEFTFADFLDLASNFGKSVDAAFATER